jgi:SAM-dependent methyltransferase
MKRISCRICGHKPELFRQHRVITDELARIWQLKPRERAGFDRRESSECENCGGSLRSRAIAETILLSYPESRCKLFADWVKWAKQKGLAIAEINYCGQLHKYLAQNPKTKTSQYQERTIRARIANRLKGIRSEDITKLSYPSESFDLVLHSEVLEHVEDTAQALAECRRILKPGGICLFTVPLIMERKSKHKVKGEPSYHGSGEADNLVYWEFGGDLLKKHGLKVAWTDPANYMWVLKLVNRD